MAKQMTETVSLFPLSYLTLFLMSISVPVCACILLSVGFIGSHNIRKPNPATDQPILPTSISQRIQQCFAQ